MANWDRKPFAALLKEPVRNGIYKTKEFHGRGCKIVNMGELFAHSRMYSVPMKRVELNDSEQRRFLLEPGDLIFARRSLTAEGAGKCSVVLEIAEPTTFESSIIRARPNPELANPEFLFYFFNSLQGYQALDTIRRQVAVAGITGGDLSQLLIPVPPLPIQNSIAHTLSLLDRKIELNQRMNETLAGMAQAIFRDWFIDFGPVRRRAAGATDPSDIIGGLASDPARAKPLAALFPAAFGNDGLPVGWKVKSFGDLIEPRKGRSITRKTVIPGNIPVIAGGLNPAYYHNTLNVKGPVITISASGANAGFVRLYNQDIWASDCSFISRDQAEHLFSIYTFLSSRQDEIYAMQQGAAQPHIYPSDLKRLVVTDAPKPVWKAIEQFLTPIFELIASNEKENNTLAETRDYLLPLLMSGSVRVTSKAEAA